MLLFAIKILLFYYLIIARHKKRTKWLEFSTEVHVHKITLYSACELTVCFIKHRLSSYLLMQFTFLTISLFLKKTHKSQNYSSVGQDFSKICHRGPLASLQHTTNWLFWWIWSPKLVQGGAILVVIHHCIFSMRTAWPLSAIGMRFLNIFWSFFRRTVGGGLGDIAFL